MSDRPMEPITSNINFGNGGAFVMNEPGAAVSINHYYGPPKPAQAALPHLSSTFGPVQNQRKHCPYYNLIVGYPISKRNRVFIDRDRALTEYIDDDVRAQCARWSKQLLTEITFYPALITDELSVDDADQQCTLAQIIDINVQENGVRMTVLPLGYLPMSFLTGNMAELAIGKNELHRTHWTIKQVDLPDVLDDVEAQIKKDEQGMDTVMSFMESILEKLNQRGNGPSSRT